MPLSLFPYQEFGAGWLARRERGGLLDCPGVGKSSQAIRAIDLRRGKRGVVICPAHVREHWRGEFGKFSHFDRKICKAKNIHDYIAWARGIFDILLLSYEMAVKWTPYFHEHAELLDFIILDECHYINNLETKRAKALLGPEGNGAGGLCQWGVQVWLLSGTLLPNDPSNAYAFLMFTKAIDISFPAFVRRYFFTRTSTWGQRNRPRPEMVPELQALIANNSIRRTLDQVGIELPAIFLTTTLVDGDTEPVRALLRATPGLEQAVMDALENSTVEFGTHLRSAIEHIATLRRLIAEAKSVPYAEMLVEELQAEPERKVVVMGVSRDALLRVRDTLAKHGIWCVIVQGGVSENMRVEAVQTFQSNPLCRVFIGNMRAAGTGLTLTAAAHIDILESDWAPAVNDQAIKRIRRIGQHQQQHARFITLARSLDEVVNRIVAEKTANIAMVEGNSMITTPQAAE